MVRVTVATYEAGVSELLNRGRVADQHLLREAFEVRACGYYGPGLPMAAPTVDVESARATAHSAGAANPCPPTARCHRVGGKNHDHQHVGIGLHQQDERRVRHIRLCISLHPPRSRSHSVFGPLVLPDAVWLDDPEATFRRSLAQEEQQAVEAPVEIRLHLLFADPEHDDPRRGARREAKRVCEVEVECDERPSV